MNAHSRSDNCRHLLGSLSEYVDGELRDELCAVLEQHLQECENCRIVVDTLRKTIELYQHTAGPADLPESVRQRLFSRLELDDYLPSE